MDSNAHWCSAVQENSVFEDLLVSGVNMYVWLASLGRNEAMYWASPKNARWYAKGATKIAKRAWALDQSVALWGSESVIQG